LEYEIVVPGVELLESMRSVGYSFEAAVADIVDNSITAGSRDVEIDGDPVQARFVTILDDGAGMDPDQARAALQLAGSTRAGARDAGDLGRFGLGLKTASLSQARRLTVVTKRAGVVSALQWDVDHVMETGNWSLQVLSEREYSSLPRVDRLLDRDQGTLVVWTLLDYMLGAARDPHLVMADRLTALRGHLGLTFHRFLTDAPRHRLSIRVNGETVDPIDPFLSSLPKTQVSEVETFLVGSDKVSFQAYTLPHPSNLPAKLRQREDLAEGMRAAQGFYVYRNRRLISHGHWYGLARREELSKQSRVQVDIPNTVDHLWQLDIKKSRAEPPQAVRTHFRRVIERVIGTSKRVHTFRGRREVETDVVRLWDKIRDRAGVRYEINAEHPAIAALLPKDDAARRRQILSVLADLSSHFPLSDLYLEMAQGAARDAPVADDERVIESLRGLRDAGAFGGAEPEIIALALIGAEPFNGVDDLRLLIERVWNEEKE
jgi:DNA-directed RNA polymerase subunit L